MNSKSALASRTAWGYGAGLGVALALSLLLLSPSHLRLPPWLLVPAAFLAIVGLGELWLLRFFVTEEVRRGAAGRQREGSVGDGEKVREEASGARARDAQLEDALRAMRRSGRQADQLKGSELFGLIFWDGEGRVKDANPAAELLLGRTGQELVAQSPLWTELFDPEDSATARLRHLDFEVDPHPPPLDAKLRRADGSKVPVRVAAVRMEGSEREGVAFLEDISARQRAEDALHFLVEASVLLSSSLEYSTTLARVPRLVVSGLADWCVVELEDHERVLRRVGAAHADPAKEALAQTLIGQHPLRQQGSGQRPPVLGRTESEIVEDPEALMRELAATEEEAAVVKALGCRSAMVVPLVARERTLGALLLVSAAEGRHYTAEDLSLAEDVARRCATAVDNARLYLEAQEAVRVRDEFLSIASHELKTPLTSLHLQLQSVRRAAQRAPGQVLPLEVLEPRLLSTDNHVRRLARLIDELLDISRIRLGRLQLSVEDLDLAAVVREVVTHFRDAHGRECSPMHVHAEGVVTGLWDRLRLEQVISNLLTNALKYGGGHPIEVSVEQVGGRAQLRVRDYGIGIPLDQQVRIFERFERAVSARHFGGMGLGLYIVRQIVEAHGGSVRVQSRPGQGSLFTVELPATVSLEEPLPSGAPA